MFRSGKQPDLYSFGKKTSIILNPLGRGGRMHICRWQMSMPLIQPNRFRKIMKPLFKTIAFILSLAAISVAPLHAQQKAEPTKDIVDTTVSAGSFKTLAAALTAAGLVDTLKGDGPFTIFAPTDEAFAKLPKGTVEAMLKPENKAMLHELISHHVVPGEMPLAKVLEAHEGQTLQGSTVNVHFDDGCVKVNHSNVVKAEIHAPNSMIHVIDRVIMSERIQISEDSAIMMTIIRDGTGKLKDVKTLEDLHKIPGINITAVPVTPRNSNRPTTQDLIGFIDSMEINSDGGGIGRGR